MYSVVEYLFPDGWYNKMKYEEGFVADSAASKVLSMARIRQLRVKPSELVFSFTCFLTFFPLSCK